MATNCFRPGTAGSIGRVSGERRKSRRRPLIAQGADRRLVPDAAIENTPF